MKFLKSVFLLFIFPVALVFTSCGNTPNLKNFDSDAWKNDRNGCKGDRLKMWKSLKDQEDLIKGAGEMYLLPLLGRPDRTTLGSRNLRNYTYFVNSGNQCDTSKKSLGSSITIYFNATNLANEIQFHQTTSN